MTESKEIDFGWWTERDGRKARLSWTPPGSLYLFHTNQPATLLAAVGEDEARAFAELLDSGDTVDSIVEKAVVLWG